jgi:ATP-dependent Clp protease ATP-binding subunit ClpA
MKNLSTNKFSKNLNFALHQAQYVASSFGHPEVLPMHLILGLSRTNGALAAELLNHSLLERPHVEEYVKSFPPSSEIVTA